MKSKKEMYCRKCMYLLLLKRQNVLPLCVATARFLGGPLREKMNVRGMVPAEKRNRKNNCLYFRLKIFEYKRVKELKEWVRRNLNAEKATLKEYPVEAEEERCKALTKKPSKKRKKARKRAQRHSEGLDDKAQIVTETSGAEIPKDSENSEGDNFRAEFNFGHGKENSGNPTTKKKNSDVGPSDRQKETDV